jgi:hypothetical protein
MNSASLSPFKKTDLVSPYIQIPENIQSFDFDTCHIDEEYVLKNIAGYIFQSMLHVSPFDINTHTLAVFISLVAQKYNANPFHNFQHAVNVLHTTHFLLLNTNILHKISPVVIFALLIASLCHDIDHPGHTNAYEIQTFSKYAKLYNDNSVLENHHCTTTFEVLEQSGLLQEIMDKNCFVEFRKTIICSILGTDMAKHAKFLKQLSEFDTTKPAFSLEEQYILCKLLLHSADLSSSSKPFDVSMEWSKRILFELQYQDNESESPHKTEIDMLTISNNEINFITNITLPLWELFISKFDNMHFVIQRCKQNLQSWRELHHAITADNLGKIDY